MNTTRTYPSPDRYGQPIALDLGHADSQQIVIGAEAWPSGLCVRMVVDTAEGVAEIILTPAEAGRLADALTGALDPPSWED